MQIKVADVLNRIRGLFAKQIGQKCRAGSTHAISVWRVGTSPKESNYIKM